MAGRTLRERGPVNYNQESHDEVEVAVKQVKPADFLKFAKPEKPGSARAEGSKVRGTGPAAAASLRLQKAAAIRLGKENNARPSKRDKVEVVEESESVSGSDQPSSEEEDNRTQKKKAPAPPQRASTRTCAADAKERIRRTSNVAEQSGSDDEMSEDEEAPPPARPPPTRAARNTRAVAKPAAANSKPPANAPTRGLKRLSNLATATNTSNKRRSSKSSPEASDDKADSELEDSVSGEEDGRPRSSEDDDEASESSEDEEPEEEAAVAVNGGGARAETTAALNKRLLKMEIHRIVSVAKPGFYSVKMKGASYREQVVVPQKRLESEKPQLLHNMNANRGSDARFLPEWTVVERLIAKQNGKGGVEFLVKWKGLDYKEATWMRETALKKDDQAHIDRYHHMHKPRPAHTGNFKAALRDHENFPLPTFGSGRALRDYQVTSVRWMVGNFCNNRSCILGDEMGLGKTAQSISVLECIRRVGGLPGPFLIVAPLTTLVHWQREVQTWTDMNVVLYTGDAEDRKLMQEHELFFPRSFASPGGKHKFDCLLTSYDMMLKDARYLSAIPFVSAIFDEAHKLKGINSSTRTAAINMQIRWKLLLTGTPIQNNMSELFSMMNILNPNAYPSLPDFLASFGGGDADPTVQQIRDLQEALGPLLLRRMKEDVETLPEKEEVIIWVQLTVEQRAYYKALYSGQIGALLGGTSAKNLPNMRNLAMELRKLCCHPYLCNGLEDDIFLRKQAAAAAGPSAPSDLELLTRASGKMVLLSKLLPKLRAEKKRVLIFSQFKIMLDQLENFLQLSGYPSERIDGSVGGRERQQAIDRFTNGTDDECFVFLLSTRAGGQGITLTAADTCIIYDSDWNPQNDLQAMARCHRIGQAKEVKVYRLLTKDTYEEKVFQTASRKYGLDEAILGFAAGSDPEADSKHIADLLRNGAHSLISAEANEASESFAKEEIDEILTARTEKRQIGAKAGNTFSVARFASDELEAPKQKPGATDADYWKQLLPDAAKRHEEQLLLDAMPLDPRARKSRTKVNYSTNKILGDTPVKDKDGSYNADDSSDESAMDAEGQGKAKKLKKMPLIEEEVKIKTWSKNEVKALEDFIGLLGAGRWSEMTTLPVGRQSNKVRTVSEVAAYGTELVRLMAEASRIAAEPAPAALAAQETEAAAMVSKASADLVALKDINTETAEGAAALCAAADELTTAQKNLREVGRTVVAKRLTEDAEKLGKLVQGSKDMVMALSSPDVLMRLIKNHKENAAYLEEHRRLNDLLLLAPRRVAAVATATPTAPAATEAPAGSYGAMDVDPAVAATAAGAGPCTLHTAVPMDVDSTATGATVAAGSAFADSASASAASAFAPAGMTLEAVSAQLAAALQLPDIPRCPAISRSLGNCKLPQWWNSMDDHALLRGAVLLGYCPPLKASIKTLLAHSQLGFQQRVSLQAPPTGTAADGTNGSAAAAAATPAFAAVEALQQHIADMPVPAASAGEMLSAMTTAALGMQTLNEKDYQLLLAAMTKRLPVLVNAVLNPAPPQPPQEPKPVHRSVAPSKPVDAPRPLAFTSSILPRAEQAACGPNHKYHAPPAAIKPPLSLTAAHSKPPLATGKPVADCSDSPDLSSKEDSPSAGSKPVTAAVTAGAAKAVKTTGGHATAASHAGVGVSKATATAAAAGSSKAKQSTMTSFLKKPKSTAVAVGVAAASHAADVATAAVKLVVGGSTSAAAGPVSNSAAALVEVVPESEPISISDSE